MAGHKTKTINLGKNSTSSFIISKSPIIHNSINNLFWVLWGWPAVQLKLPIVENFLKNPAIWLANSILAHNWRTAILPDVGFVVKYQEFYFRSFPGKTNGKSFRKILFWVHFGQKWLSLSVFKYPYQVRALPVFK